jgi:hypothetical protein
VEVTVVRRDESAYDAHSIPFDELPAYRAGDLVSNDERVGHNPFWLTARGDTVVAIDEQFGMIASALAGTITSVVVLVGDVLRRLRLSISHSTHVSFRTRLRVAAGSTTRPAVAKIALPLRERARA